MSLFIPITKVDAAKRLVYGTVTEEIPDKTGEILDYASAKPAFLEWSQQFEDASGGKSLGNVRAMHGKIAAGKFTDIAFDDEHKRISGVAKIIDDDEWEKVLEGVYTGFSIGGGYARRWPDEENPALMRYTPVLHEVSLVDNPAVPTATFDVIKSDGSTECRKFIMLSKEEPVTDGAAEMETAECAEEALIESLLQALDWLEQDITNTEDEDAIMPHIIALQQYLGEEDDELLANKLAKYEQPKQALLAKIQSLQERITQLEKQPMPGKGVLRAVSKGEDRHASEAVNDLQALTSDQRTHVLMKMALANPIIL